MDDEIGFLEGPFDSDEAADAVAEIEVSDGRSARLRAQRDAGLDRVVASVRLQEFLVFGTLATGPYAEQVSRGRLTAEAWIDFGHPHLLPDEDVEREVAADLHRALSAAGRYLGLASLPPLPA
ncbi:hypothetical protein F5972_17090 [Microbispora cellulosiformans]|uniref:Uncharacterized protein n=1 Tax=Microbispora cellulosiformans TaxID=2614688 RepID=A0A5J5K5Z1_9ACTN|nr:hypothetical protein [Microbispora cellulosiformans]KAA9378546.1 hypothetical protein F5972_17090 [Microbispora cellulosiformans]